MEVYIEQVIIDNFLIDFMILSLTKLTLKEKVNKLRFFLTIIVATFGTVFYPLINLNNTLLIIAKFVFGMALILLAFKISSFKNFVIKYFLFLFYTFLMGGAIYATLNILKIENYTKGYIFYNYDLPVSLILFLCFLYFYFFISLIKYLLKSKHISKFIYEVSLTNNNKVLNLKAFLDSGNTIIDPDTHKPINIINFRVFNKLYEEVKLEDIILHNINNLKLKNAKYISFKSLNKTSNILTFELDELLVIDKNLILKNIRFGLSLENFKSLNSCEMILNSEIFG